MFLMFIYLSLIQVLTGAQARPKPELHEQRYGVPSCLVSWTQSFGRLIRLLVWGSYVRRSGERVNINFGNTS